MSHSAQEDAGSRLVKVLPLQYPAYPFSVVIEPLMSTSLKELVERAHEFSRKIGASVVFECNGGPLSISPTCDPQQRLKDHQAWLEKSRERRERPAAREAKVKLLLKTNDGLSRVPCDAERLNTDSLLEADLTKLAISTRAFMVRDLLQPTEWETKKFAIEEVRENSGDSTKGFSFTGRCERGLLTHARLTIMETRHVVRDVFGSAGESPGAFDNFRDYVPRLKEHFIEIISRQKITIGQFEVVTETRYRGVRGLPQVEVGPGDLQLEGGQSS